ncbi:ATP-binding cassette domain-containing protein [Tsuneonella suprasediminis]|uniref:ATP-binding cassette domain-containing protein n=2 Tax=Tsuneonella suprasediminis TaxID=2306996 RepID=A0A419R5Z7_9SPHN|nr:ATP-binding cassette domain-containing protein [Tsuneonella suprasediminis]
MLDELLAATGAGRRRLRVAGACGLLASLSAVALLGLSGWFLTAAGLAGLAGVAAVQAFNYLIPSAAIRLLAILRTVGRYGERLLGHQAALEGMADLRTRLFSRRAAIDTRKDARDPRAATAILLDDIAALEDIVIRRPAVVAGIAGGVVSVALVALAGWGAALFQAVALLFLPMAIRKMAERFTAKPSADVADRLIAMRATFTDFVAARSEIAAYGFTPLVMKQLEPTFHGYEAAKARLLRGEAITAAALVLYTAVVVAGVLLLADGAVPLLAAALLASAAGTEAVAGFSRNAMRKSGIEKSLERLATLSQASDTVHVFASGSPVAEPIGVGDRAIEPGERVAITGISGSGKTRLLEALAGLRSPDRLLTLNGVPVESVDADHLRRQFALMPQDPMLLMGSIADNLRIAAPALDESAMFKALAVACLDERIAAAPQGLNTWLEPDGGILSGGERKRLALARALLAGRPWLLLDEPTEGLDSETEIKVVTNLARWLDQTGTGLILVSHRPFPLTMAGRELSL